MQYHSWEQLIENEIVKNLDYSSFNRNETGIPQGIYSFFNLENNPKEEIPLTLIANNIEFSAYISWAPSRKSKTGRARIHWYSKFSNYLKQEFPNWRDINQFDKSVDMKLAFRKTSKSNVFNISSVDVDWEKEKTESEAIQNINQRTDITETEKVQLVKSRIGHGLYRNNLQQIESRCRFTGLTDTKYLIHSHIKPWAKSNDSEKLDGNNGLLLSPHIDKLFDGGYISFSDDGYILTSSLLNTDILSLWNIDDSINIGKFNEKQKEYLSFHRRHVFKG